MEEPLREYDPARILHARFGRLSAVLGTVTLLEPTGLSLLMGGSKGKCALRMHPRR